LLLSDSALGYHDGPEAAQFGVVLGHAGVAVVESPEGIIEELRFVAHAVLVEAAHERPSEDLSVFEFLDVPPLLQQV
jgi:hypothetical protein